jgi:nucleotide-binding universal stress UspA family protein
MVRDPRGMLVGVDGSEASLQAADWAAADAVASGRTLTVCFVSDLSVLADVPLPQDVREEARAHGGRLVDRAIVRVRGTAPAVDVTGRVEEGNPAAELLHLAAGIEQVVLGSRGSGGFGQLILGSVGAEVAAHAPCPVTVVRGEPDVRHEVVVGVDASDRGQGALDYAFGYAARHGMWVHAVHAVPGHQAPLPLPPGDQQAGRELVAEAVAPWALKYPAVEIETTIAAGTAAAALRQASQGAALLVVGSRGHGGFAGLLLGSVSLTLLRHAHCPVVVAR